MTLTMLTKLPKYLPVVLALALLALHTYCLTGLYSDGAYLLAWVRHYQSFAGGGIGITHPRSFMFLLTEWPTVIALRLGVTNVATLTYLHSLGWYAIPTVAWLIAFWRVRETNVLWIGCLLFAVWLNAQYGICEATCAYALCCASAMLLLKPELERFDVVALCVMGIALTLSYESVCVVTAVLAVIAYCRSSRSWPVVTCFAAATLVMAWYALHPTIAGNAADAARVTRWLENRQLLLTAIAIGLAFTKWWPASLGAVLLLLKYQATIYDDYKVRALIALILVVTILAAWKLKPQVKPIIALALLAVLGWNDLHRSLELNEFITTFRTVLPLHDPGTPIGQTRLWSNRCVWPWGNPCLSVLLREPGREDLIIDWTPTAMDEPMRKLGINIPKVALAKR